MTPNSLSPNYAHWAAGASFVVAAICYVLAWSAAATALAVLGAVFEGAAWFLLFRREDGEP
ncbi:MAG TPA: hypothetical protein VLK83_07880 [Rhodanobacteraceae bacterium]|nr:hypothetical protein [Rhodanobacteraceae bacterium]